MPRQRILHQRETHDIPADFPQRLKRFSEELKLSFKALRDHALTVDGGTVKQAKRQAKGAI